MKPFRKFLTVVTGCLVVVVAHSQTAQISGSVADAKNSMPLPFANVFINNTTLGTTTDVYGQFVLKNVPQPSVHEIVISFVGYEAFKMKVSVAESELRLGGIKLNPVGIELGTVEVKGTKDVKWEKDSKKFKTIFLGEDKFADQCTIINPWVLDFSKGEGTVKFKAIAHEPIQIENKALGYKINFYLTDFHTEKTGYLIAGDVRFEEMSTGSEKEKTQWGLNREKSYLHSPKHLFKSILDHRIDGEGFNLYSEIDGKEKMSRLAFFESEIGTRVARYDTSNLVTPGPQKDIYKISLKGRIEVHYRNEKLRIRTYRDVFYPVSWIRFNKGFVLVNKNGAELNPADISVSGEMSKDRVASLLPINYVPDDLRTESNGRLEDLLPLLQEKIYVHTDKPYYYPGESLWFKGYVNYRSPSLRDSLSRTVYVEFVDIQQKAIILSKTIKIDSGAFVGDFMLSDTIRNDTFYLRAYTNLNRNFGDENLYVKAIPILKISNIVSPGLGKETTKMEEEFTIVPDKTSYVVREKITLTFQVKDDEGEPLASNLSVSVTDATQTVPVAVSRNILEEYPINKNQIITDRKNVLYPVEYGICFSGRFLDAKNNPAKATLNIIQLKPVNFTMAQSDENGKFSVGGFTFYDSAQFTIQASRKKGELYGKTELLNREVPPLNFKQSTYQLNFIKAESPHRVWNEPSSDARMLEEVVIRAPKIPEEYTMAYRTKRPYGRPDYMLKAKNINVTYGNLAYALQGKFPGVEIRQVDTAAPDGTNGDGPKWMVFGRGGAPMLITINDNIVGGEPGDVLTMIDPSTVESVEVKKGINVLYGNLSWGGILAIYTKFGPLEEGVKQSQNLPVVKVPGYATPRKFKYPDYNNWKTAATNTDYRSLIYWNPHVVTDDTTGTSSVSFFAADLAGRYYVVAEGVSKNGTPVRAEYFIEVTKH